MVSHGRNRIDGWWSRKTAVADSARARVLVLCEGRFPIERTGALEKTKTPTPEYALDNAVVVIEGMTRIKDLYGTAKAVPFQNTDRSEYFRKL